MQQLVCAIMLLAIAASSLPFLRSSHWTVRIFDFPRLQVAILHLAGSVLGVWFLPLNHWFYLVLSIINGIGFIWQVRAIFPYTPLARRQVRQCSHIQPENSLSVLSSNVLTHNRNSQLLLQQIHQHQPDLVLTLESDAWWETQLDSLIEHGYIHNVKVPQDNLYGIHLYSRLPLRDVQVRYRVDADIPSIVCDTQLPSGVWVKLFCLHPMPPSPTEAATATDRDAELLLVGKEIAAHDYPVLVLGDLNDVAWSPTSRLFQRISGLLDPRQGRGLYNTFHAHWPLMRWPLDHIFHSADFTVIQIKVLPDMGSDHFPIYGRFCHTPAQAELQVADPADCAEKSEAADKIAQADPHGEIQTVRPKP